MMDRMLTACKAAKIIHLSLRGVRASLSPSAGLTSWCKQHALPTPVSVSADVTRSMFTRAASPKCDGTVSASSCDSHGNSDRVASFSVDHDDIDVGLPDIAETYVDLGSVCSDCLTLKKKRKLIKLYKKELHAVTALFARSGFLNLSQLTNTLSTPNGSWRHFSTTSNCHSQEEKHKENKDDSKEKQQDKDEEEQDGEDGNQKMPLGVVLTLMMWLGFLVYVLLKMTGGDDNSVYKYVSWNEFVHDMLSKGEVSEVIVRPEMEIAFIRLQAGAVIRGRRLDSDIFAMKILDTSKFENKIRKTEAELGIRPEKGVAIRYQRENAWASLAVLGMVVLAVLLLFKNFAKVQLPSASDMFASQTKAKFVRVDQLTQQGINFKDVAGLREAKIEVMEFVDFLKRPQRYKELGAKIPKGSLLLGPPGCGKTLLAKAVANEAKVPFLAMAGSEFVEMLGGLGAARVRDLFKEAREKAPCIVYIDEIDAIGRQRSGSGGGGGNQEEDQTLNQLLVEMDGIGTSQSVIVMGSTNRPDILDKALLRAGRFDRHIMIDFPTLIERIEIFDMYLQKLKTLKSSEHYSERLAQLSPGSSGADIANICNEAALHAARDKKKAVGTEDFDYAVERVSSGVAKKSRVLSPQEKKVVAYHEAGHALVGWLLEHTDAMLRVSIVPRTNAQLGSSHYLPADKQLVSKDELFEKMCMSLGGRVAESLTFNTVTSGAHDDLTKVSKMAYAQIQQYGMNERLGLVAFPPKADKNAFGTKPYSKQTARIIDEEARKMVQQVYKRTEEILKVNKEKLRVIAEALLEKEALTYKDMEQLIGPPPYGSKQLVNTGWDDEPETDQTAAA